MSVFVHHLGLAVAVCALGAAGLRVAAAAGVPPGLARVVAAVVLAAGAAVAEALALGLVALGGSSVALVAAAVATWLAARALLPPGGPRGAGNLHARLRGLDRPTAVAAGAVTGLVAAWTAWMFLHPALGHDMVLYHLPEAIQWVHSGHTGAVDPIITGVPVGSYPLTHEVLLEWGLAIGRSFVWATLVTAMAPVLAGVAAWVGLRAIGVDRLLRALAVAALVAAPAVLAPHSGGATLDPAALGWLVSCAALCAVAAARVEPLAPALVAAALAIGTKTTTAPLALGLIAVTVWRVRGGLRGGVAWLAAACAVGVVDGGVWYLRNTIDHGWPLWPFSSAPWGDARPSVIVSADVTFLDRPGTTLDRLGDYYLHHIGGALVLFGGALVVALLVRSRAVLPGAGATLVSVFVWMNAPFTGVVGSTRTLDVGTGDATRYLLPASAAAALTVALAGRRGGRLRILCALVLAAAAIVGVRQTFALGFPNVPSLRTPAAGIVLGGLGAALLVWRLPRRELRAPRWAAPATAIAAVLAAGAIGAAAASGFVERHGTTGTRESPLAAWFADRSGWRDGAAPVASTWSLVGTLAGDRLQHPLVLLGARRACARAPAGGWLVVDRQEARARRARGCGVRPGYSDPNYQAYGPGQLGRFSRLTDP